MDFLIGFISGSLITGVLFFVIGKQVLKKAVADAETLGINQGAVLESEIGWTKKK